MPAAGRDQQSDMHPSRDQRPHPTAGESPPAPLPTPSPSAVRAEARGWRPPPTPRAAGRQGAAQKRVVEGMKL